MYYDYNDDTLLGKLNRKFGRYGIKNSMMILIIGMIVVWAMDYVLLRAEYLPISSFLYFDRRKIFEGEVWRLITFVFLPEESSLLFIALYLYFMWFLGACLENEWGYFKFNVFLLCGYLGSVISGFITGFTTNYYFNLTLFLAFAILNPNMQVRLFFFIPIKVKWLALIDAGIILLEFIVAHWIYKVAIAFALLNIILFFWRNLYYSIRNYFRRKRYQREVKRGYGDLEKESRRSKKRAKVKDLPNENVDSDDLFN